MEASHQVHTDPIVSLGDDRSKYSIQEPRLLAGDISMWESWQLILLNPSLSSTTTT